MTDQQRDQRARAQYAVDMQSARAILDREAPRMEQAKAVADLLATARKEGERVAVEYWARRDERDSRDWRAGVRAALCVVNAWRGLGWHELEDKLEALAAGDAPRTAEDERADVVAWLRDYRHKSGELYGRIIRGEHIGAASRKI